MGSKKSPESRDAHRTLYRVRNIPATYDRQDFLRLLARAVDFQDARLRSYSSDITLPGEACFRVAIVSFGTVASRWRRETEVLEIDNIRMICDKTFDGFTPLSPIESDNQRIIDCIVLTGWGGHPIGSFMAKESTHVWLIDKLAKNFPQLRLYAYGYSPPLQDQTGGEDIYEFADTFVRLMRRMRSDSDTSTRRVPIIYLAHSLGGLLFKEAMIRMKRSDHEIDQKNLMCTYGALLFGVPSLGMDITALASMVGHLPARTTLHDLDQHIGNRLRHKQHNEFCDAFDFKDSVLARFFELDETPTVVEEPGTKSGWSRNGPPAMLVGFHSATLGRHWENADQKYVIGLKGNHSTCVKFSELSTTNYYKVYDVIEQFIATSPSVIKSRLGSPEDAMNAGSQRALKGVQDGLIESLSFPGMGLRQLRVSQVLRGTCQWIFQHEIYHQWMSTTKSSREHNFLWIKGKAGSGKSSLMRTLVERVKEDKEDAITASFFFDARGSSLEKSPLGLFRTLLVELFHQVSSRLTNFPVKCVEQLKGNRGDWTQEELKDLLRQVTLSLQGQSVYIFIDALDECEEELQNEQPRAREVVRFFEDLLTSNPMLTPTIFLCMSSRHYPQITVQKCTKVLEICMEKENGADIIQYVNFWLQSESSEDGSSEEDSIIEDVVRRSNGVFLWVVLVVQKISAANDRGKPTAYIKRLLETTPATLTELFSQVVHDVDSEDRLEAFKLIQWTLFAKQALTLDELQHALAFHCDSPPVSILEWKKSKNFQSQKRFENRIRDLSRGLLELTIQKPRIWHKLENPTPLQNPDEKSDCTLTDQRPRLAPEPDDVFLTHSGIDDTPEPVMHDSLTPRNDEAVNTTADKQSKTNNTRESYGIQFIHETVREFLSADGYKVVQRLGRCEVDDFAAHSHSILMNTCINYIAADDLSRDLSKRLDEHLNHNPWPHTTLRSFFGDFYSFKFDYEFGNRYPFFEYATFHFPHHATFGDLGLLGITGAHLVERLVFNNFSLLEKLTCSQKSLLRYMDSTSFEKDLLDQGLLQFFARRGSKDCVEALLDHGLKANESKVVMGRRKTSLEVAIEGGHRPIIKLLLDRGADASVCDLSRHARLLDPDILRSVLAKGADVNARDPWNGQTALYQASVDGDHQRVKILLGYGADVNIPSLTWNLKGFTPLEVAKDTDIAALLRSAGRKRKNVDSHGKERGSQGSRRKSRRLQNLRDQSCPPQNDGQSSAAAINLLLSPLRLRIG